MKIEIGENLAAVLFTVAGFGGMVAMMWVVMRRW